MSQQHDKGKQWQDGKSVKQVAETDGSYSEQVAANLYAWDATAGAYVKLTVDHASGALAVIGASEGAVTIGTVNQGNAGAQKWLVDGSGVTQPVSLLSVPVHGITVADGADVAQGSTADASSANTVVGLLKAIKTAVQGAITTARNWTLSSGTDSVSAVQSGTWTVQPGNTANSTAWKVDGSAVTQPVSGTFWQTTQPVSGTFWQTTQPVSGTVADSTLASSQAVRSGLTEILTHDDGNRLLLEQIFVELVTLNANVAALRPPNSPQADLRPDLRLAL